MTRLTTRAYCLDPDAISALKRDGLGWGHDLECGCLRVMMDKAPARRGLWSRFARRRGPQ